MLMLPGLMPTRGLVHNVFRKCKLLWTDSGLLFALSFLSRGLPSLFIYVVVTAGQDPGRAENYLAKS